MKSLSGVTLALVLVLGATPGYAQVGGGVEGGVNFSKVSFSGSDVAAVDTEFQTGLIVGGFLTFPVGSTVAIMPEVAYSQKHSKLTASDGEDTFSQKLEIEFVSVPVLVKVAPPDAGGFYFVFGPGFNFRTKTEATDSELNGEAFPEADEDLEDTTESFDFSLIAGAGFARGSVGVEARYDHGLRNLNSDPEEDVEVKSRAFTILLKIFFR